MLLLKKIVLIIAVAFSIYSATSNANTTIMGRNCTLGLPPFGIKMAEESIKNSIIDLYSQKGYFVSLLASVEESQNVEFISDASVECTPTYFGTMAQTTVRLIDTSSNKILKRSQSTPVMDLWNCKIDLLAAISNLPNCEIK